MNTPAKKSANSARPKTHNNLTALIIEERNLDLEVKSLRRTAALLAALLEQTENDAMKVFAKWQKVNARVLKKLGRDI